jgi:uncharacterized membrane protein YfcA
MFLGSGLMSLAGVQTAEWLQGRYGDGVESTSAKVIGAALVLGALGFLAKTFVNRGIQPNDAPFLLRDRDRVIAIALGAAGGYIVGLTSVGSGTFFALIMLLVFPLTAAKIVGTDIFHAAALLWVAGLAHLLHGNVDLGAMSWLLLGSIPGILLGTPTDRAAARAVAAGRARDGASGERRQAPRGAGLRRSRTGDPGHRSGACGDRGVQAAQRSGASRSRLTERGLPG